MSCVRNLQNGTEPIRLDTKTKFDETFSRYGLRDNWFHAGYGLAENVVGLSWVHEFKVSKQPGDDGHSMGFVAVGNRDTFDASLSVKIVDPVSRSELQDGEIGEIWIAGPSVAAGYYGRPKLSREVFHVDLDFQGDGQQRDKRDQQ